MYIVHCLYKYVSFPNSIFDNKMTGFSYHSPPPPPSNAPTFFICIFIDFKPIYFCKFINPCFFPPSPRGTHRTAEITPGRRVNCFYAGRGEEGGRAGSRGSKVSSTWCNISLNYPPAI